MAKAYGEVKSDSCAFNFVVLVTEAQLNANTDGKARLKLFGDVFAGSPQLATDPDATYMQITLLG